MDILILVSFLILFLLICFFEKQRHLNFLQKIPVRIHINGTRGKSSVARLIAAGLRNSGIKVICKTTGSQASIILDETTELAIKRGCTPNIIEQCKVVEFAQQQTADVLVIECMALKPELQAYSELHLIKSTHGVITNCGPDHLDVMGPGVRDVALALAGTVPINGRLYTNEKTHLDIIDRAVSDRHATRIDIIAPEDISYEEMHRFSYIEHKENIALALTICRDLGVDRKTALAGLVKSKPDLGAMDIKTIEWQGSRLSLMNAFAANDPVSSKLCWQQASMYTQQHGQKIMLVNCRQDRLDRSSQLAVMCATLSDLDKIIVVGCGRQSFIKTAIAQGISKHQLIVPVEQSPQRLVADIVELSVTSVLIVGIGNIKEFATNLLQFFEQQSLTNTAETIKI